ncbi:Transcriptional regulator SlyA [Sodalis praecaptivus]|nr:Transcriptional regulator SlyA [Sodalis praecaptivus]
MNLLHQQALMAFTVSLVPVARAYRARADKVVAPLGLSAAIAWPLVLIGRHPESIRPGSLSMELGIEGPSLVRSLNQLVEAGLVLRQEDSVDNPAKILFLTEAGAQISARIENLLNALRDTLFAGIPQADIEICLRTFSLLEQRLGINGLSTLDSDDAGTKD